MDGPHDVECSADPRLWLAAGLSRGRVWCLPGGWNAAVSLLAVAILGCSGAIDSQPFSTYAAANQELAQSSDSALDLAYEESLQGFLQEASRSPSQATRALLLRGVADDPFGWEGPANQVVLPWKVAAFRSGVDHLNVGLVGYAALLSTLASGESTTIQQVDQIAIDLNGNLKSAAAAFGKESDSGAAILSTAAAAGLKAYIESKRRGELADAIETNQSTIEAASALGRSATRGTAVILRRAYQSESTKLARRVARGGSSVQPLFELDVRYIDSLQVLRRIDGAYRQLPRAHRQLATSLEAEGSTLEQIKVFYQEALRLNQLYRKLKSSSGGSDSSSENGSE